MPFYRMDFEDGKTGIVHMNFGRRSGPAPCVARDEDLGERCARMSVALCDYPVGQTLGGKVGSSRVDLQACKLEYSIVSPK